MSFVCPNYCGQFNFNKAGCVASQNRGFGCAWYADCQMCINDQGDDKTPLPSICPVENKGLLPLELSATLDYNTVRPETLHFYIDEKQLDGTWLQIFDKVVANTPEKEIPYKTTINESDMYCFKCPINKVLNLDHVLGYLKFLKKILPKFQFRISKDMVFFICSNPFNRNVLVSCSLNFGTSNSIKARP